MGEPTCNKKELPLQNIIDYLAYPEKYRDDNAKKSIKYKRDFRKALRNSGFDIDTNDEVLKYWYKHVDNIPKPPKKWDWRNVRGIDYISKPRTQGDCGSCYVIGSISSIEARLRIATKGKLDVV